MTSGKRGGLERLFCVKMKSILIESGRSALRPVSSWSDAMRKGTGDATRRVDRPSIGSIAPAPDLMDVIAEIERRVGQLQTVEIESADSETIERERRESLEELATRQYELNQRETEQADLAARMASQREEVERLSAALAERERGIASREGEVGAKAGQIEEMRGSLEAARAELASQQKASKQLAEAQEREQRRLKEYKEFLAQREQEIEEQAEAQRKMRRELAELAQKLSVAEKENKVSAVKTNEEREAAKARIAELESRCSSLEESCKSLKSKKDKARPALMTEPAAMPMGVPVMVQSRDERATSRTAGFVLLLMTTLVLGVSVFAMMQPAFEHVAIWGVGFAFLVPLIGCSIIRRRGVDFGLMMVAMFAGLFGLWFEPWSGVVATAIEVWHLPLEVVPAAIAAQLPLAAAVLTACVAASIATGLATDDFEVLFRGLLVSCATGGVLLVPDDGARMIVVAAGAIWVLLHTALLTKWAGADQPGQVVVTSGLRLI